MIWKILVLILAGAFMTAVVIWLGRQMILFLEELLQELDGDASIHDEKGEKHE